MCVWWNWKFNWKNIRNSLGDEIMYLKFEAVNSNDLMIEMHTSMRIGDWYLLKNYLDDRFEPAKSFKIGIEEMLKKAKKTYIHGINIQIEDK